MNEPTLGNEWDLGDVLAERVQPDDTVTIYLNEAASFTKAKLLKEQKGVTDPKALKVIEDGLAEADKALEDSKYVIYLRGVTPRMRDDIHSKAMHEVPVKPTGFLGQDDPVNAEARQRVQDILMWEAHIKAMDNPVGLKNTQFTREFLEQFYDGIPESARNAVNGTINELTTSSQRFVAESKNPDFSLKP